MVSDVSGLQLIAYNFDVTVYMCSMLWSGLAIGNICYLNLCL